MYFQILTTMFDQITKHLKACQKYSTTHCIIFELSSDSVFGNVVTQNHSCSIYITTNDPRKLALITRVISPAGAFSFQILLYVFQKLQILYKK